jgi:hypothetical protein
MKRILIALVVLLLSLFEAFAKDHKGHASDILQIMLICGLVRTGECQTSCRKLLSNRSEYMRPCYNSVSWPHEFALEM